MTEKNKNNKAVLWTESYLARDQKEIRIPGNIFHLDRPTLYNKVSMQSRADLKHWLRQGHHFKTTALVESPFMTKLEKNSQTGKYVTEGSFSDLLQLLGKTMNFTYTIEPPPDDKWGGRLPNGSWNGMMNLVDQKLADFGKLKSSACCICGTKMQDFQLLHLWFKLLIGQFPFPLLCLYFTRIRVSSSRIRLVFTTLLPTWSLTPL